MPDPSEPNRDGPESAEGRPADAHPTDARSSEGRSTDGRSTDRTRRIAGRKPGDRRVRVDRPHAPFFRYTGPGQLVAKQAASRPTTPLGRVIARFKAVTIGRPLANEDEITERLPKKKALAIFSSDAISSSAYATEEILRVLVLAGAGALLVSIPIAIAITLMLTVVTVSYRQVCRAYPNGGGAYVVAQANLAPIFGLIAAAALLIDYVMTVAVSTSSALDQIFSIAPDLERSARGDRPAGNPPRHRGEPARPPRVGQHLRRPDLPVRRARARHRRRRGVPHRDRRGAAAAAPAECGAVRDGAARDLPDPARLRQRLGGPDRSRGDRQRRAGLQATRGEERGEHDDRRWRSCSACSSSASPSWRAPTTSCPRSAGRRRSWRWWRRPRSTTARSSISSRSRPR